MRKKRMRKQIKLLIIINSFFVLAFNLFAPLYALFIKEITDNIFHVGAVASVYIFLSGVLIFFISKYENKLRFSVYFIIAGFIFRAIGWGAYIFANSIWQVYAIQIFLAMGHASGSPSYVALFSKYLDKGKFASEWGANIGIFALVAGIAALLSGIIVENFGFTTLFLTMIALSFISTIIALSYRKTLGAKEII